MRGILIDLTGIRSGRLVVVSLSERRSKNGNTYWNCKCDCGNVTTVYGPHLRNCATKSCGCLGREITSTRSLRHGKSNSTYYRAWSAMLARCRNPKNTFFKDYGGRGIKVCERWTEFSAFFEDMGEKPPGYTIDRIDNNGNYCPENCRWASQQDQQLNKRTTVRFDLNGRAYVIKELLALSPYNIGESTLRARLRSGWPAPIAISKPIRRKATEASHHTNSADTPA